VPRYLWRRPSGYIFQIAPPQRFLDRLGVTPFRISLGPLPAAEARSRARVLAGYVTAAIEGRGMTRETVSRGLAALAAELEKMRSEEWSARLAGLRANSAWREEVEYGAPADQEVVDQFRANEAQHMARVNALQSMRARLDLIGAEIRRDGEDWDKERAVFERTVDRLASLKGAAAQNLPLLSVIAAEIIEPKNEALGKRSGYAARLRRAVRAFIAIVGDKTVDQYVPRDLQVFTATLGQLPATWNTDRRLRD
jgi:hypothetical protein